MEHAPLSAVLGAVLALNLALGTRGFGSPEITQAASEWQEKTKGVTYAPPVVSMRRFKILRLQDKLPGINAMMFGSSTVMGVTEAMFPAPLRTYNFTLTANETIGASSVSIADFIVTNGAIGTISCSGSTCGDARSTGRTGADCARRAIGR